MIKNTNSTIYAFLDVETTGLSPAYNDRVCEIAILLTKGNKKLSQWHTLVNPERLISPGASVINNITDHMVKDAPKFSEVANKILSLLQGTILVCHNAPFDINFLFMELEKNNLSLPDLQVIDTLKIARRFFNFPSNSLSNIAGYLGINVKEKHRALADVITTQKIFRIFLSSLYKQYKEKTQELIIGNVFDSKEIIKKKSVNLHPVLEEAISSNRMLHMKYRGYGGAETERVIKPMEIVNYFDYLYLIAFCHLRQERRTFRLDRIMKMKVI